MSQLRARAVDVANQGKTRITANRLYNQCNMNRRSIGRLLVEHGAYTTAWMHVIAQAPASTTVACLG